MKLKKIWITFCVKKKNGSINIFTAFCLILFAVAMIFISSRYRLVDEMKITCEDAMVSSTLAGAIIDIEEYGKTGNIIVTDYKKSYQKFKKCLNDNLRLDNNDVSEYTSFFSGPINVTDYIIYNVNEETGEVQIMQGTGEVLVNTYKNSLGNTFAPDGTKIVKSSIYSKIKFDVRYSQSTSFEADKDCCVDITK